MKFIGVILLSVLLLGTFQTSGAVTQEDVVGFWTFELQPGFNLIAFPVLPDNPTVQNAVGDKIGVAEITTWDSRLGRYRYSRYNTQTNRWEGDLYVLSRGTAFWINILEDESKRLVVTGHPEVYTKFTWSELGTGWKFYAPTIGKPENLNDLPPISASDLLAAWDPITDQFKLVTSNGRTWEGAGLETLAADQSYIVYLNSRQARRIGPPTQVEAMYTPDNEGRDIDGGNYINPPFPLIVGNSEGLPVCNPDGGVCTGGFAVKVIREAVEQRANGIFDIVPEVVTETLISQGAAGQGRFRMALTINGETGNLRTGDRVYLVVEGSNGAQTQSTSFEIPAGESFLSDISFPNPMSAGGGLTTVPSVFALGTPYPNPFNSRFRVEVSLPQAVNLQYGLYDLQGRAVYSFNQPMSAGIHRLTIDPGSISSGVYFFKVNAGVKSGLAKVAFVK